MLSKEAEKRAKEWLGEEFDAKTRKEVQALFDAEDWVELENRFYQTMEFGTGGLRGVMGAGTNRMNQYTVAQATQGLAAYINKKVKSKAARKVAISYDSRNRSKEFAASCATVLAANGIKTYLFRALRPTPELSFAVRELGCCAGVMVTASHNPKEYNGYKAYWADGKQLTPPHDKGVIAEARRVKSIRQVKTMDFKQAKAKGLVEMIGAEVDRAFLKAVKACSLNPKAIREHGPETKIVFTPLHGTGGTLVPQALKGWGFKNVICEPQQMVPNGDFPTAKSPNPEEPAALNEAIKLAKKKDAELVMATDPDADRLGIAVREGKGKYRLVTGNELGAMIAYYVCETLTEQGRADELQRMMFITTIVTSDLSECIAPRYGVSVEECLTGFKWIAGIVNREEEKRAKGKKFRNCFYGYEESYGYALGTHCRDKDAVVSACIVAEMACWARSRGQSLIQLIEEIVMKFGAFVESQVSIKMEGKAGAEKIGKLMDQLRSNPPKRIGQLTVLRVTDYVNNVVTDVKSGAKSKGPGLPKSNVLEFELSGGSKLFARPSGTEPKIKFYFNFCDRDGAPYTSKKELNKKTKATRELLEQTKESFLKSIR
ncbi:phospho-sugar mutase [Candidatus Sumerlaeota bacterium]|nr:phospho-sugar mutase [Candidatus Sumerlaeota bacterium]